MWQQCSPGQRAAADSERIQRVLMRERTGYEVGKQGEPLKVVEKKRGAKQEGKLCTFPFTHAKR